jgi:hypothetical protein
MTDSVDDAASTQAMVAFSLRAEEAKVAKLEAEAGMLGEAVVTEQANRKLRNAVSVVLVIVNYLFPAEPRKYA